MAGSVLAWFASAHAWMTAIALAAVVGGWLWIWRESFRSKARPARSILYTMSLATLALMLALAWPFLEPTLIEVLLT